MKLYFWFLLSSLFSVFGKSGMAAVIAMGIMATPGVQDAAPLVPFRNYQQPVFWDHATKTLILHWSRQIGKSYTLAAWAVDRILRNPGRLVTVLSNSRDNGAEFVIKCQEVCDKLGQALEIESNQAELDQASLAEDVKYNLMRFEVKITIGNKVGRIKVLAANPRTARGFSGDLILDEFAFHENSRAIWEAAEPIISANRDFLCRIASTGNGRMNMFYQLISEGRIPVNRVRRSDAWRMGELRIYSVVDGREITPDEARAESSDKRAYDQNYECAFEDENMPLLTPELISAAERSLITIDRKEWTPAALARMMRAEGDLYLGQDFARTRDLSVQAVIEKIGTLERTIGVLAMENMRTPAQLAQLNLVARMPKFKKGCIDMTGNGLGLFEFAEDEHGEKIEGVNFATTEPVSDLIRTQGRKALTARVTEIMATALVAMFEAFAIEIPADPELRDDLRKPEKIVSPGGRVSIAATRDASSHADFFWAYALAHRASETVGILGSFFPFGGPVGAGHGGEGRMTRSELRHSRKLLG
jgi:phage FluMu gp28-like protein